MSFSSSGKKTEKKGSSLENLLCELFWIGVFSLTAKAALSISFDTNGQFSGDKSSRNRSSSTSDTNPIHCKMMCLVGTLYCFFVDFSFFEYQYSVQQVALGLGIAILTLTMLSTHAQIFTHTKEVEDIITDPTPDFRGRNGQAYDSFPDKQQQ